MSTQRFDVLVAGGGPAGCGAAVTAARAGLRVILVERQEPPFRKVCGEFLSAGGLELWRELTRRDPPPSTPLIRTARFFTRERAGPRIRIDPPARGLSRAFLDGALLEAARAAGVHVVTGASLGAFEPRGPGGSRFRALVKGGGGEEEVGAGSVVLATGRPLSRRRRAAWWLGRKGLCGRVDMSSDLEMLLLAGGGYVGVSPLETGEMGVCALAREGGGDWLSHPALVRSAVEARRSVARFTLGLQHSPPDGALRAGDALAVWPPVVGDGITAAMASGVLLGRLLAEGAARRGRLEPADWMRAWRAEFSGKLRLSLAIHRLLESRRGRSALLAAASAFPRLGEWLARATRTVA